MIPFFLLLSLSIFTDSETQPHKEYYQSRMQADHSNLMDITPVLRTLPASNKLGLALQPRRPRIFDNCLGQCVMKRGGLSK
jgi:hypothetical protein